MNAVIPSEKESENSLQIVTVHLGDEVYGIDISLIHTVIMPQPITHVPKTPAFISGIMNLRGRILPVIDLRVRFGMAEATETRSTSRIVIVNIEGITAGLIVDAVSEVYSVAPDNIRPTPDLGTSTERACVHSLASIDEKMVMLLDIDKLVTSCIEAAEPASIARA